MRNRVQNKNVIKAINVFRNLSALQQLVHCAAKHKTAMNKAILILQCIAPKLHSMNTATDAKRYLAECASTQWQEEKTKNQKELHNTLISLTSEKAKLQAFIALRKEQKVRNFKINKVKMEQLISSLEIRAEKTKSLLAKTKQSAINDIISVYNNYLVEQRHHNKVKGILKDYRQYGVEKTDVRHYLLSVFEGRLLLLSQLQKKMTPHEQSSVVKMVTFISVLWSSKDTGWRDDKLFIK